jgi:hypothetical protein
MQDQWIDKIFSLEPGHPGFETLALQAFRFQYDHNPLYRTYADMVSAAPGQVSSLNQVPFLPVSFFKTHAIQTTEFEPEKVFESSGTTQTVNSRHLVKDTVMYRRSLAKGFESAYGDFKEWCVIGLLPSYLERNNSSLVYMVDEWIRKSNHPQSGFYLDEYEKLVDTLKVLEQKKQKTLLIGVSFALLDLAEKFPMPLKHTTIMETGGMKGRRKELTRQELHEVLKKGFGVEVIHSEYGMTELLSQAYSKGEGIFYCPPWMRIMVREEEDPLRVGSQGSGVINIIDLANIYSCCFIATDDAGKLYSDGSFEVLGRIDNSDIRGCSLMV